MTFRLLRGAAAAPVLLLSSCMYHPGAFRDRSGTWPANRVTTHCLDLAFARTDRSASADSVIAYRIGNRCDDRVVVDLASVRAFGRDASGYEYPLRARDPRNELAPHALNALWSGQADVAYETGGAAFDTVCLDISHIEHDHTTAPPLMCLGKGAP